MKILAVWDDIVEAEQIAVYLGVDEKNTVTMTTSAEAFLTALDTVENNELVLLSTSLPDAEGAYRLFERVRLTHPQIAIVGACHPTEVFRIVRFMANGMSAYLTRDPNGDFMFLMQSVLSSTVVAVRAAREKELTEKLRAEVEAVRKLQESVLPKQLPAPAGYRIVTRFEPAHLRVQGGQPVAMAGGDYYDVFTLPDGRVVLLMGDATGHGMKACMSIMTMHTLVHAMRRQVFTDTAHFVTEINKGLCDQAIVNQKGGFITLLYAVLDPHTGILQWSSAGHQPPLVLDDSTGMVEALAEQDAGGLPLAVDEDAEYAVYNTQLPKSCRLLMYTDGLEEAFPEADEKNHFGKNGIIRSLINSANQELEASLADLYLASDLHTCGSGRQDDTSVILCERRA
jgi:serine phosphatase RsbU (regulator of sigma subunit)